MTERLLGRRRCGLVLVTVVGALLAGLALPSAGARPLGTAVAKRMRIASPFVGANSPHDALLRAVVSDLDSFWRVQLPKTYGVVFSPLKGYYAATERQLPPPCGRSRVNRDDISDNAFYCRNADYIAWDEEGLFSELFSTFGEASLAVVLAHETAHAMQARAHVQLPDVYAELQADCFAGAWFQHVLSNQSKTLRFETGAIDDVLGAILAFRDNPGTDASSSNAHGNGFDRLSSFQIGYESGTKRCSRYSVDRPTVTATTFSVTEASTRGDLPLPDAISFAERTANEHFAMAGVSALTVESFNSDDELSAAIRQCNDGFGVSGVLVSDCPERSKVFVSVTRLRQIYGSVKDAGVAYAVVLGWAAAAERNLHRGAQTANEYADGVTCFVGSWLGSVSKGNTASLSPGDLDEAISAAIGLTPEGRDGTAAKITGFARIEAIRKGFQGGLAACK